jgi:hypothetical protein
MNYKHKSSVNQEVWEAYEKYMRTLSAGPWPGGAGGCNALYKSGCTQKKFESNKDKHSDQPTKILLTPSRIHMLLLLIGCGQKQLIFKKNKQIYNVLHNVVEGIMQSKN